MVERKGAGRAAEGREAGRAAAGPAAAGRAAAGREADHAAIARLADELLPSLIAKLGASGLGEIEVREGPWHVRLRGGRGGGRARGVERGERDRAGRSQPGHEGHGHAPGAIEGGRDRPAGIGGHVAGGRATSDRGGHGGTGDGEAEPPTATSPAVGFFQSRSGVTSGTKVRAGDRIAAVEVLGIPQDVLAPVDGIVGASLVEPGQAVEYGQDLIVIELASARPPSAGDGPSEPAGLPTAAKGGSA